MMNEPAKAKACVMGQIETVEPSEALDNALDCLYTKAMHGRQIAGPDGYAIAQAYDLIRQSLSQPVPAVPARVRAALQSAVNELESWNLTEGDPEAVAVIKEGKRALANSAECPACAKEQSGVVSGGTSHTCIDREES